MDAVILASEFDAVGGCFALECNFGALANQALVNSIGNDELLGCNLS